MIGLIDPYSGAVMDSSVVMVNNIPLPAIGSKASRYMYPGKWLRASNLGYAALGIVLPKDSGHSSVEGDLEEVRSTISYKWWLGQEVALLPYEDINCDCSVSKVVVYVDYGYVVSGSVDYTNLVSGIQDPTDLLDIYCASVYTAEYIDNCNLIVTDVPDEFRECAITTRRQLVPLASYNQLFCHGEVVNSPSGLSAIVYGSVVNENGSLVVGSTPKIIFDPTLRQTYEF